MSRAASDPSVTDVTGGGLPAAVLHVDMDAFYASVEIRRRPELVGQPVIVGGAGSRGVVLSASYPARRFGVHSAMPVPRALRLCPGAVLLPPDFPAYRQASDGVMAIFRSVTPLVQPLSLDEAFLDVRGAARRLGDPVQVAQWIRARVYDEQQLTCSVGVAPTLFLAKLASTQSKPDGLLVIPPDRVVEFLHPLPVRALWGVGARTGEQLERLGLRTVADLAATPVTTLVRALGAGTGNQLAELAWGRDPRHVTPHEPEKSLSAEQTFERDMDDLRLVQRELLRLCGRVGARLREAGLVTRTITLKIRFADFTTLTRSRTLPEGTDVSRELYRTASELMAGLGLQRVRVRLVGVRAETLLRRHGELEQLQLAPPRRSWRDADLAADRARRRFGAEAVRPASLVSATAADPDGGLDPDAGRRRS